MDVDEARRAVAEAATRFAALLAGNPDLAAPVPGLSWTAVDLVAHVVSETASFAGLTTGEVAPDELWERHAPKTEHLPPDKRVAVLNADQIARVEPGDLAAAGERVQAAVHSFLDATEDWPTGVPVRSIEGDLEPHALTCVLLGELVVHGHDLSRSLGLPYAISARDARLVLAGAAGLLPHYLDARAAGDMRATLEVRVRGGHRMVLWVHDGVLEILDRPEERIDCRVSADPVAFLLVSYGRQTHWRAAARGQLLAWGRRPWIAMTLPAVLRNP